ncbi:TPA: hypothetical protein QCU10_005841 [Bacillus anthracis]|nr:hypothetical protein [Bacillus cereus biovar anthracis]HDR6230961.1 hypothetical protein [Bacillus cereus biovar anthracis]HDR6240488.1 hypothetical protein [Bacillus cereus biovar anthracis]HDR6252432.1 hypothetical protein [Bacillus cereus biovar anthracis]
MREVNLKHRYWVFGIDQYYPVGGLDDVTFSSDSIEEAIEHAKTDTSDSVNVFDSTNMVYIGGIVRGEFVTEDDE